jgi:hypothetical protein
MALPDFEWLLKLRDVQKQVYQIDQEFVGSDSDKLLRQIRLKIRNETEPNNSSCAMPQNMDAWPNSLLPIFSLRSVIGGSASGVCQMKVWQTPAN